MLEEFAHLVADVEARQPRIRLVSNVSGQLAGPGYGSAHYWVEHVRQPVRFFDGVHAAEALGAAVFVEVGPGGGLSAAVDQSLTTERPISVVTMPKDRPEIDSLLSAAGRLFTSGVSVDWPAAFAGVGGTSGGAADVRLCATAGFGWEPGRDALPAKVSQSPGLAEQLYGLSPEEQHRQLVELVCEHAAVVLGHPGSDAINRERAFQ